MPSCEECNWRDGHECRAHMLAKKELKRPIPPAPTGACTIAIVDNYLKEIKSGMKVLEIGCGVWSKTLDHCNKVGAHYEGLDVQEEYYGIKCIATRIENLADLSYSDSEFDIVIGNQTMEHWAQHGCTMEWGLYQCFRVVRPGGRVFLNVPIHFHGTKYFLHGKLKKIEKLFSKFSNNVKFESWGNPSDPIAPYYPHPNYQALKDKPAYVLDIESVKDRELPKGVSNTLGFNGRLSQIFHNSISYNLYRVRSKVFNG